LALRTGLNDGLVREVGVAVGRVPIAATEQPSCPQPVVGDDARCGPLKTPDTMSRPENAITARKTAPMTTGECE
jgi:hypothetical protein